MNILLMNIHKTIMKKLFFVLLIIWVCLAMIIEARKKKKRKVDKKPEDPKQRRPSSVKPELYCDACQAIIKELTKSLYGKKKESDVYHAMSTVCDPEKFYVYCNNNE